MKKIEQAANEHTSGGWTDDKIVSFKAGVEFAQRWISVEEELPQINGKIILIKCSNDSAFISSGFYDKNGFTTDYKFTSDIKITHWRPITIE